MNITSTRIVLEKAGQRLKSAVENPVVVMTDETWKAAKRIVSATLFPTCTSAPVRRFSVIRTTAAAYIIKYHRISSIANASSCFRIRI